MKKISTLYKKDSNNLVTTEINPENDWVFNNGIPTRKFDGTASMILNSEIYKRFDRKLITGKKLKNKGYYINLLKIGMEVCKVSNKIFSNGKRVVTIKSFDIHPITKLKSAIISSGDNIDLRQLRPCNIELLSDYYINLPFAAIPCQDADPITGHHPHWVKCDINNPMDKWHFDAFDKLKNKSDGTYELCGPKVQSNPEKFEEHILIPHGKEIIDLNDFSINTLKSFLKSTDIEGIVFHNKKDTRMCKIRKIDFGIVR